MVVASHKVNKKQMVENSRHKILKKSYRTMIFLFQSNFMFLFFYSFESIDFIFFFSQVIKPGERASIVKISVKEWPGYKELPWQEIGSQVGGAEKRNNWKTSFRMHPLCKSVGWSVCL